MSRRAPSLSRPALAAWWRQRSARERVLLGVAGVALAGYLLLVGVAQPLAAARASALAAIAWHDAALARLAALPEGDPAPAVPATTMPVNTLVTATAQDYDLTIRRIEAEGAGAELQIEDAGFPELILWIEELERDHGLGVVAIEMTRQPEPGVVSARLTLQR